MNEAISVIIPSRLRHLDLLCRAIQSVDAQIYKPQEIIIGLDNGAVFPDHLKQTIINICSLTVVASRSFDNSQADAVNTAVEAASSEFCLILEDDDTLHAIFLVKALEALRIFDADLVSSCSALIEGPKSSLFTFPCPSGWLFRKADWINIGGFDNKFKCHLDNEMLGRITFKHKMRRVHLVPDDYCPMKYSFHNNELTGLTLNSWLYPTVGFNYPLVNRYSLQGSALSCGIASGDSDKEHRIIKEKYGSFCW